MDTADSQIEEFVTADTATVRVIGVNLVRLPVALVILRRSVAEDVLDRVAQVFRRPA